MARILAIHAHPDDCEILAGGTLALLAERGHHITIATFTPGDCGSRDLDPDAIATIRRREAAAAAALIGAEYTCLDFRDLAIFNDDPSRRRVAAALRAARPEIVLTASPIDYMVDHETASALVRDTCFVVSMPNYHADIPALDGGIPHLYFMDPLAGRDRDDRVVRPDFVVDVAAAFERKRAMLAEHRSQREWLRAHHGVDEYLIAMERWTIERGELAGVPYGEGFRQYRGHAYPQTPLLQDLLTSAAIGLP
jgi:LmbE family N-acetylglucosaminyl deacetylase